MTMLKRYLTGYCYDSARLFTGISYFNAFIRYVNNTSIRIEAITITRVVGTLEKEMHGWNQGDLKYVGNRKKSKG